MNKAPIPRLTLRVFRNIIFFVVFTGVVFWAGYGLAYKEINSQLNNYPEVRIDRNVPAERELNFDLFWRVWDIVDTNYYDSNKLVPAKMVYGAIKGMVAAVGDPYTTFLDPVENKVTEEDLQGNFSGVGIQIGYIGTQLAVIAPLPDSPAEKAGVLAGDYIIGIKDEAKDVDRGTVGITLPEAVETIRGPKGSIVTLALVREGVDEPLLVDVTRDTIDVPSVTLAFVGDDENIAHLRILKFGGETKAELDQKILEIQKKSDLAGIIIDVRNNPGGYLQGAVEIGNEFLDTGEVVVIEEKPDGSKTEYKTTGVGRLTREQLVVLINKGSASASEILAGALRDQRDIPLVGTVSFGKGTIQERQEFEEGVALHITAAKWLTPDEVWVNDVGLTPDYEVKDDPETPEDEQLDKAVELLLTKGVL